ncbi:MAG: DoxX family protein [Calditrichaeota bacterium]|nr:MAG: DoxX family protein [Calditrichota bacterium]
MQALTTTVARILYALPFGVFGLFHFMNAQQMSGMVPSFLPAATFWVYLTGLALLAACISMIIQKYARLATLLLAIMLGIFILTIHIPGVAAGNQPSMMNLLKDLALAAAALHWSGEFAKQEASKEKVTA